MCSELSDRNTKIFPVRSIADRSNGTVRLRVSDGQALSQSVIQSVLDVLDVCTRFA